MNNFVIYFTIFLISCFAIGIKAGEGGAIEVFALAKECQPISKATDVEVDKVLFDGYALTPTAKCFRFCIAQRLKSKTLDDPDVRAELLRHIKDHFFIRHENAEVAIDAFAKCSEEYKDSVDICADAQAFEKCLLVAGKPRA